MPFQFGRLIWGFFGSHIQKDPFQIAQRSLTSITSISLIFQDNPIVIPSGSLPSDADPNCCLSSRWALSKEQCLSSSYFERSAERIHSNFDWSLCSFLLEFTLTARKILLRRLAHASRLRIFRYHPYCMEVLETLSLDGESRGERSSLGLGPWI